MRCTQYSTIGYFSNSCHDGLLVCFHVGPTQFRWPQNVCFATNFTLVVDSDPKYSQFPVGGGGHFEIQYGGHQGQISGGQISENICTILMNILFQIWCFYHKVHNLVKYWGLAGYIGATRPLRMLHSDHSLYWYFLNCLFLVWQRFVCYFTIKLAW